MEDDLSPAWRAFARLQASVEKNRLVNCDSFADEEALTELADDFKEGEPTLESIERRLFSLLKNRWRKYRRRRGLLRAWLAGAGRRPESDPCVPPERLEELREELVQVNHELDPAEWQSYLRLAEGESIATLAEEAGVSAVNLRVKFHRRRRELLQAVA